ncbi:MAG: ribosome biogenesis GTPase Der [Burkholderiales bacterium]|nr:ribosome biogenesis GTPase Der [Burkholderiales bacterium]
MKPVVALVGRPNVGKSTLFNRLTRSRAAIVADVPGVTRDRHYGEGRIGARSFIVVDTGGLAPGAGEPIYAEMARQAELAIAEADAVILVTDARAGLVPADREIAERLRRSGKRVWVAANKCEGLGPAAAAEFHELGLGAPAAISAEHGDGVAALMEAVLEALPQAAEEEAAPEGERHPRVAIVGRPNVGKSTLVNALVGEERVIAAPEPGTTRDAIEVPFERGGRRYTLVDTAGLRRRGRSGDAVERFSIVKTLQAIERANVAVLVLDALAGVAEQDAHIAGYILERGRAVVVAVNKWEAADREARARAKQEIGWKLPFLGFAETVYVSARTGKGIAELLRAVDAAYGAAMAKLATPQLTRALAEAVARQAPPRRGYVRPKPRYAHQGGSNPPVIVVHGNALEHIGDAYRRYLEGWFRRKFRLKGTPLRIEFRTAPNPYVERRAGR